MKFRLCLITLAGCILLVPFVQAQNRGSTSATRTQDKMLTYARSWESDLEKPESVRFRTWTSRYFAQATSDLKAKQQLVAEGVQLAKQRHAAFAKLIAANPEQAIALSVPASIRERLPAEILREIETRVSGIGDFTVMAAVPARGGPPVEPIWRSVRLNKQTYRAYVYGRRIGQTTKYGIPLHGVALDDNLALADTSLRELESGEMAETTKQIVDLGGQAARNAEAVLAEIGGKIYRFASPRQMMEAEANLEAAEAGIGPKPKKSAAEILELGLDARQQRPDVPNGWTTGNKKVLIIRVDFSDIPGDPHNYADFPFTAPYVQNVLDTQVGPHFLDSSYGVTTLTNTATPQVYRMPQTAAYYATTAGGNNQLHVDAKAVASADYTLANYDRIGVLFSFMGFIPDSQILYAGAAAVGGPELWFNGYFEIYPVVHELGHTYGLLHANLWHVSDGNAVSPGAVDEEYGDEFDSMGAYAFDTRAHFNPWFKNMLEWLADNRVQTVTADGVYRVYRFDTPTPAAGPLALKISRSGNRDYWISCRRNFTDNPSMQNGAYIIWGYNFNRQSDLLDMTTPGNSATDAALAVGSTFTDPDEGISIEVLDQGGTGNAQYIDVGITIRSRTVVRAPLDNDPGWTRQGEWAFGVPTGQGGAVWGHPDPTSGATGTNVFGTDLNGDWSGTPGVFYYLTSGPFNLTGYTHSKLRFSRWLNTDYQACAYVTIDVSSDGSTWTTVWNNDSIGEITDSSWTQVIYDISAIADNKPTVFVRWGYKVNCAEQYPYSGWNIDDIEFIAVPPTVFSNSLDVDPGWTRQGQWAFGTPTGGGGTMHGNPDPTNGVTGTKVFGVNLTGDYSLGSGGPFYLTAGPFNFAGRRSADLRFARWLNSDSQPNASATIDVSTDGTTWTPVWNNGVNDIADAQWSYVDYNISTIADFQPRVYVRWGYTVSGAAQSYSGWNIDDVALLGALPQIVPTNAVSRKTQGAGTYDINLPLSGAPGIECRAAGAGGTHQIVVTFAAPVTSVGASVIKGTGSVSSISGNNTNTLTVNLSGVSVAPQLIVVKLANVTDGAATSDLGIQMGLLPGDTSGSGIVNSTDVTQVKSQSGQPTTAANFRQDVNNSGSINSTDVSTVKAKSGTALP